MLHICVYTWIYFAVHVKDDPAFQSALSTKYDTTGGTDATETQHEIVKGLKMVDGRLR